MEKEMEAKQMAHLLRDEIPEEELVEISKGVFVAKTTLEDLSKDLLLNTPLCHCGKALCEEGELMCQHCREDEEYHAAMAMMDYYDNDNDIGYGDFDDPHPWPDDY